MSGWVCIHRQIRSHWIYEDADKLKAWICILMEVNHSDKKIAIGNTLLECKRGDSLNSLDTWASLFGKNWDKSKVRRFFNLLKSDSMIVTKNELKTTRLSVCNYVEYQGGATRKRHASDTQTTPNNNVNNENKDIPYMAIIEFLNEKTGKNFKHSSTKTKTAIKARFSDGFVFDDFIKVIKNKVIDWSEDKKMSKFLRPETLFSNKFEGYLNESVFIHNVVETDKYGFEVRND